MFLALVMGQVFKPGVGVDFGATAAMFSGDYADKGALPGCGGHPAWHDPDQRVPAP